MSDSIQTEPQVRDNYTTVACACCGHKRTHTDHWQYVNPETGEQLRIKPTRKPAANGWGHRMEKSHFKYYPTLGVHLHHICYHRLLELIADVVGIESTALLHDRITIGSVTPECCICHSQDSTHVTDYAKQAWLIGSETSALHIHRIFGYVHTPCIRKVLDENQELGLDNPAMIAKINPRVVSWTERATVTQPRRNFTGDSIDYWNQLQEPPP